MAWESQRLNISATENAIGHLANRAMGNKFPDINHDIMKTFNLYRFFVQHLNTAAANLQPLITENGQPIFTVADIEEIQAKIRSQNNTQYVKHLKQLGGTQQAMPVGIPVATPDPSRNKFWDKLIRRVTYPIWSNIPPSWDGIMWYVFLLYSLEQAAIIGPFISTALDTITLTLPNIPSLIDSILPKLIGLIPLPYMSTAGDLISYAIGLIFIILGVFLNIQRKHFGSAFKTSIEILPIIGDNLAEIAQSVETGAERYEQNRNRIISKITPVTPSLGNYLEYYVPNMDIHTGPAPQFSIPAIKQDLVMYAKKEAGINEMMNKIPNPANMVASAVNGAVAKATNAATGAITKATNAATGAVTKATNVATGAVTKATNAVVAKATNATNAKSENKTTRKKGGGYKGMRSRHTRRR
jgi:hypothetical protein